MLRGKIISGESDWNSLLSDYNSPIYFQSSDFWLFNIFILKITFTLYLIISYCTKNMFEHKWTENNKIKIWTPKNSVTGRRLQVKNLRNTVLERKIFIEYTKEKLYLFTEHQYIYNSKCSMSDHSFRLKRFQSLLKLFCYNNQ